MITIDSLIRRFNSISWRYGRYDVFSDIMAMAALSLSNGLEFAPYPLGQDAERREYWKEHNERAYKRENRYLDIVKKYNERELKAIAEIIGELAVLLSYCTHSGIFHDYLGKLYMSLELGNKNTGQFFTPYGVSYVSAKMTIGQITDKEIITVADPTVGAGGMLLAAADVLNSNKINYAERMLAYGCDVDIKCVYMTYLQLSWAGVPAIIEHGNTLTQEIWDEWQTPAYIFNYLHFQPTVKRMREGNDTITAEESKRVIGPVFYF